MPNEDRPTIAELEEFILSDIQQNLNRQIGIGQQGIAWMIRGRYIGVTKPTPTEVTEAIWSLVARGLVYIDFSVDSRQGGGNHSDPAGWLVYPTERARQYAQDELPNPDCPEKYLKILFENVPKDSDLVALYIQEALQTYSNQNYTASAVMLGVAAEAAFLDMLEAFCSYLSEREAEKLRKGIGNRTSKYTVLLEEFRCRLEPKKKELPIELHDKIDLQLNSVLDLIRRYRNDSGHPTGFKINRAECHQSLVLFAHMVGRLYALKTEFEVRAQKQSGVI